MGSDGFYPLPLADLAAWMLGDLERGECFGLPASLFFRPRPSDPFRLARGGRLLETPVGVAAGPHAQLPQNLVAAYLCGARFMELKTVQVLDELHLSKPCIDMLDEGYNCEWSQELRLKQSARAYVEAYVLLHVLKDYLKFEGSEPGFVFNLSAGYSYDGVTSQAMSRFFSAMTDASHGVARAVETLAPLYPRVRLLAIEPVVSRDLTMSTMHGVAPGEIERIAAYFIEDLRLDFTLKLNPTLLGPRLARELLNERLGYPVQAPDEAFAHDLEYGAALELIARLSARARNAGVAFRLKLTNTLPVANDMGRLPSREETVYLSGRALHPLAVVLAHRLRRDVDPRLDMSFCAGLDAENLPRAVACGLYPATICSDALKPGGYGRIRQAVETLRAAMARAGAGSLEALALTEAGAGADDARAAQAANLAAYAAIVADEPRYRKAHARYAGVRTERPLPRFDCAGAPCVSACALCQDVPGYLAAVARGEDELAWDIVRADNAFPRLLGAACDQRCRSRCVRQNLDSPLAIREIKAFVAARGGEPPRIVPHPDAPTVAVLGAGAVGLAASARLARTGLWVRLFETSEPGGGLGEGLPLWREATGRPGSPEEIEAAGLAAGPKRIALAAAADLRDILALGVGLEPGLVSVPDVLDARPRGVDQCLVASQPAQRLTVVRLAGLGRNLADALLAGMGRSAPVPASAPVVAARADLSLARFAARPARELSGEQDIRREASRCLSCSLACSACATVCPNRAMLALAAPGARLPRFFLDANGRVRADVRRLRQPVQLFNLADACNECGNCAAFCPSAGSPYQDKPRLHLGSDSFDQSPFGYRFEGPGRLVAKDARGRGLLTEQGGGIVYEDDALRLALDASSLALVSASAGSGVAPKDLDRASETLAVYLATSGQGPFPPRPGGAA